MGQALSPGGGLLLTVPQHPILWHALDDYSQHKRRYRWREMTMKLVGAGFEVIRTTSFVSLLLPAAFVSRRLLKSRKGVGRNRKKRISRQTNTPFGVIPNQICRFFMPRRTALLQRVVTEGSKDLAALFAVW